HPSAAAAAVPPGPAAAPGIREMVYIPDDSDFSSFRDQCESLEGWHCRYNKAGVTVWSQGQEESCTVQKIKTRISCKDVPAETLYDVLHDTRYRKKWDSNMIETYDIGRLTVNADVGYYSCDVCGGWGPLKNRDFVTLRSWLPLGNDYMIINYSVKHPKYPPRKDFVRAVSLQTGYLIKANGDGACILYYLTQVDPRGSLPKWVVNRVSQFVAPKAMKKIYKAGLKYPEWKRRHDPEYKPWVYPEQNTLPSVSLAELSVQHADSLENIDETGLPEEHLKLLGLPQGGEGAAQSPPRGIRV
uniref:START domain-containing protein 10 n=2 Tax=Neoaves TaxID=3078114 RepID=A0A8C3NTD0_9PASS